MASHTGAAGNGSVPAQDMGVPAGDGIRRLAAVAVLLATLPASVVAARCEPSVEITVSPGDTLLQLCGKHLENPGRCPTIARLNHLQNPDLIHPGQRIRIPAALFRGTGLEGVITFLSGDVRLEGKGGIIEQLAGIGGRVPAGGRLVTGVTGAVEVGYEDGSSFLMRGNGSVDVVRALRRDNVFFDRELLLGKGNLITRIKRATGREQRFEIRTPLPWLVRGVPSSGWGWAGRVKPAPRCWRAGSGLTPVAARSPWPRERAPWCARVSHRCRRSGFWPLPGWRHGRPSSAPGRSGSLTRRRRMPRGTGSWSPATAT